MSVCAKCKHGHDRTPRGERPPTGTVWCAKTQIPMGRNRKMRCFTPFGGPRKGRCFQCGHAKFVKPRGGTPQVGYIWCERRHGEFKKSQSFECFEWE